MTAAPDDSNHGYPSYDELTARLQGWAEAYPALTRLHSLGRTPEGREQWLLRIGADLDQVRPAAWVDANMHASELAGSVVAMAIAHDVLRVHLEPEAELHGLAPHVREMLRRIHVYVLPRISPDGAEAVLQTGRWVRSVPRDARPGRRTRWRCHDLDGDGLSLLMRRRDPIGDYVESTEIPGVMLPRELDDPGPYFTLWPEGSLEDFDGHTVPTPGSLDDNGPDLNRNFPYDWAPEHVQEGAGPFALSEPESRAMADYVRHHPNVFVWLDLHTYGGVFIRPLGTAADETMPPDDLAMWRELGAICEAHTGYPMVNGFTDFTYDPGKPLCGDLTEFAYHARGAYAYVCELWDLFVQLGMKRPTRFVDAYSQFDRATMHRLARWDAEHNRSRVFRPWVPVEHPQLGPVEVGGVDIRFGIRNPPPERLPALCDAQSAAFLRVAAMAPWLWASELSVSPLGEGLWQLELRVENRGYLPTHVVPSMRDRDPNEPLRAWASTEGGAELVDERAGQRELGQLQGWGRGRQGSFGSPGYYRGHGSEGRQRLRWVVRGPGRVSVRVGNARVGWIDREAELAAPG